MDWPQPLVLTPRVIASFDNDMVNGTPITLAWPTANKAFYLPFRIPYPVPVRKLWWQNGGTASGNVDCGIYTAGGVKLVSTGAVAASGVSVIQEVDITDFLLAPGMYYFGLSRSGTAPNFGWGTTAALCQAMGIAEEASAHPLPAVATFASMTAATMFLCGLSSQVTF